MNPDTSGPTGASLLGSTLVVVFLLLLAPQLLGAVVRPGWRRKIAWAAFAGEMMLFIVANKANSSHRAAQQIAILGSLLLWIPLLPIYFRVFEFPPGANKWLKAALLWFALLTLTGWVSFLPYVLDGYKFTNGLVAHSHLAMAGFVTAFNLFLALTLLEKAGLHWITGAQSFWLWNLATGGFVLLMWAAGIFESLDPAFTFGGSSTRTILYGARIVAGIGMLGSSLSWWHSLLHLQMEPALPALETKEMLSHAA